MLDAETRRRIDSCRDILVGKVPDPKSQVEQITIALIYKFMDDMDAEAEELGGKRSFFAGEYARYGWAKLMAPNMGGFDVLALYSEAIGKMNENPGIPTLFRDIFKNAYLPYRDPETLRIFLKEINYFTYDHSEKLGDAFEYLLSVLGSQGDAGQFRTPRHIIDFMVEIVDPQKGERILDPACGTAGFLISAWKHILKHNTKKNLGDQLTPEQRAYIAANVHGYDISPDMVRLSLVNLYLHGFTDPHVVEYDTLTSEEKWNETADVILANPPFMSPKGGIKPHKRFSVQATRSEVLFVDYIAEHLSPNGRAAIIVPEGIIFQSGSAYKQLRQMLVKNSLVAVISLPSGVFNPYSGVKTSILLLDKWLAKRTSEVLFVKVENDGFNLGAQRRAMAGSGLPDAAAAYLAFRHSQEDVTPTIFDSSQFRNAHVVEKTRLGENGDWNLSGERYRIDEARTSSFNLMPFESVCTLEYGSSLPKSERRDGPYPVLGSNGITGYHNKFLIEGPAIVIGRKGSAGEVTYVAENCFPIDTTYYVKPVNPEASDIRYLYQVLKTLKLTDLKGGAGIPGLNRKDVYEAHQIPLPPLAIQKEIVEEIEGYQKIIDGARQVVENYRPSINLQRDWPVVALGEVVTTGSGGTPSKQEANFWVGNIPWVSPKDMKVDFLVDTEDHISEAAISSSATKLVPSGTLLCVVRSGILQHTFPVALTTRPMAFNQDIVAIQSDGGKLDIRYLFYIFKAKSNEILAAGIKPGVTVQSFHSGFFKAYQLPLPDLQTQRTIVAEIEAEQTLINANKQLIARFEAKIQTTINRVWGNDAV
ncbi:N-6 DNA methylase [Sideroxydans lithotrophicus]|uniref:site-specific DNA-methyltransferase (adenine-specific) n=1 Tax=Sideroxydans lithotrophicus (strain ES-1) TaxID=580332 RepID=D5CQU2_SIDLE|nr:N-6 DNA methylase [Sideroxydans lithotrophicus]ADE11328.1 restriction modification system DNA specificity domain protein [Sideroxydans lithotrophicus ES-1]